MSRNVDMADHLGMRARLLGHAFHQLENVWRWQHYDWHESLKVKDFKSGESVRYQRESDWKGSIEFKNMVPIGLTDRRVVEIPTGSEKVIDQLIGTAYNYEGVIAVPVTYDSSFRKLRGSDEAFSHGLTESIETTFTFAQGGEAALQKYEQEIKLGFEARQDWSQGSNEEEETTRSLGIAPESPPGYDLRYRLLRYSQSMKIKVTGRSRVDHSVKIGKYDDGWRGNKGKHGKTWPRWAEYDSFIEECLPVLKGEAPRDLPFALHFRDNPAPDWLIKRLEEPLEIPFEHTSDEFDGTTRFEQHQEVLRGPKPGAIPPETDED